MADIPKTLSRSEQTVTTQLAEDQCVVLDLRNGEYYTFNASASLLWKLLEEPQTPVALHQALMNEYGLVEEAAKRDAAAFLNEIKAAKLLHDS